MKTTAKTRRLTQLGLLVALELVLSFTPLGYLSVPGLTITFLTVPVAIGAVLLGPTAGAVLGLVFGATSFAQCFGASPFGAALLAISPVYTFLVCIVPRVLAGWLPGLLFRALNRTGKSAGMQNVALVGSTLSVSVLNTLLFMGSLLLCFFRTDYIQGISASLGTANPFVFAALFVGVQGVIEAVVCAILASIIARVLLAVQKRGQ